VARNVLGMKLTVGRVLLDQLQHLVSFNDGTYTKLDISYRIGEDHIVERFENTRLFPKGDPGPAHYAGVDLGQYLKEGKHGVFLLHLSSYTKSKKKAEASDDATSGDDADSDSDSSASDDSSGEDGGSADETSDIRLIVVTDLGLLVKKSLDGS